MNRTLVWFRRDLRIHDHAPLYRAARRGQVIPVFIFDSALLHHPETGAARVQFLLNCLQSLDRDLVRRGGRLILRSGDPVQLLPQLVRETQAEGIYAYLDCERVYGRVRDARVNRALCQQQMKIRWFNPSGSVAELIPYSEYRERWFAQMQEPIAPTPSRISVPIDISSDPLPQPANLGHKEDGKPIPIGGTNAAHQLLSQFVHQKAERYYWQLSYPSAQATTGLGPYLKLGAISVRDCVQSLQSLRQSSDPRMRRSGHQAIARLRWGSSFAQRFRYLPQLELRSLYRVFDEDGWIFDAEHYRAWQEGHTGFPIVDAAARCLQATGGLGELNFRTRAIYASFLTNLLGIDWRYGALYFMRHLIDGDCPIDHYQWAMQAGVTHCVDKSWTRIYNPEQAAVDRCDPDGEFIKRWVPELARLSPEHLGSPPPVDGYPDPIVNYKEARQRRVLQLKAQRDLFRSCQNVLPFLARLPQDLTPFGSDLVACDVSWAKSTMVSPAALFPIALDLDSLDPDQTASLRTWFVAHLQIQPRRSHNRPKRPSDSAESMQLDLPV